MDVSFFSYIHKHNLQNPGSIIPWYIFLSHWFYENFFGLLLYGLYAIKVFNKSYPFTIPTWMNFHIFEYSCVKWLIVIFDSTDVCNMEKEEGNCLAYFQNYFYNKKTQSCEGFIYGGCGGNANNFDSLDSCNRKCIQRGQLHTNTGGIQMYKQLARHKKSFHI